MTATTTSLVRHVEGVRMIVSRVCRDVATLDV